MSIPCNLSAETFTAWGTWALALATIGMILWQVRASNRAARLQLFTQLTERWESKNMRALESVRTFVFVSCTLPLKEEATYGYQDQPDQA